MLKLFQSIFGARAEADTDLPDTLIDAATERAVDGTDPRMRVLGNYRKRLREPLIATIRHVVQLVDALPPPVPANAEGYRDDACLRAMFASLERLYEVLGKDQVLDTALRAQPAVPELVALLGVQLSEKRVLGLDIENEMLKRDVQQTVVSFDQHRVVDPQREDAEARRALKRRAFDHILAQVLEDISERRETRDQLGKQRKLLRHKLDVLQGAGWSFDASGRAGDAGKLDQELAAIERELEALGPDAEALQAHLDMLAQALAEPASRLRLEQRDLILDHRNVLRECEDSATRALRVHELHDGRGARLAVLLLRIDPALVPRSDFFAAARRYL